MQGLHLRLRDIGQYLQKVLDKELPINHAILGNLQDVFNLLPNLATAKPSSATAASGTDQPQLENAELARAMNIKTNDQLMSIYISSLIRAITAFHDLIDNKIQNRQQQEEKERKEEGKEEKASNGANNNNENKKAAGSEGESNEEQDKDKGKKKD